jgi:hypothetical protein
LRDEFGEAGRARSQIGDEPTKVVQEGVCCGVDSQAASLFERMSKSFLQCAE